MTKIVKWKLVAGSKLNQEDAETKRQEGLAYIERLKEEENVISVEETDKEFIIKIEE